MARKKKSLDWYLDEADRIREGGEYPLLAPRQYAVIKINPKEGYAMLASPSEWTLAYEIYATRDPFPEPGGKPWQVWVEWSAMSPYSGEFTPQEVVSQMPFDTKKQAIAFVNSMVDRLDTETIVDNPAFVKMLGDLGFEGVDYIRKLSRERDGDDIQIQQVSEMHALAKLSQQAVRDGYPGLYDL